MRQEPLHERIRADLERRILNGDWLPDTRIPFEHELTTKYSCSRMTVSRAVTALAMQGLIVRRKRAGSFVAHPQTQSAVLAIPEIQSEVQQRGAAYRYELLARRMVSVTEQHPLRRQLERTRRALLLRCRHFADNDVFALEERAISLTAVPTAARVDFSATGPGRWLLKHVPWTQAEHCVSAINASDALSRSLGVPRGTACLVVERRTWRVREGVTHVRMIYPADRYRLVAKFGPAAQ
jgi:GntR family transcriptional regulator, histidine utilization repressor